MEMSTVEADRHRAQTCAPSLLALRHVANVIPTFNKHGALASGIALLVAGFLSFSLIIAIIHKSLLLIDASGYDHTSNLSMISFTNFWFSFMVSI